MENLKEIKKVLDSRIISSEFTDLKTLLYWFGDLKIQDIEKHIGFEDETYCRIPLIAVDQYELLLCCWKPGQESPFHGHPDKGCLVKILQGTLSEERKFTNGRTAVREISVNDVGYITDKIGIHRVSNNTKENAVSLHLYAPGGYRPNFQ